MPLQGPIVTIDVSKLTVGYVHWFAAVASVDAGDAARPAGVDRLTDGDQRRPSARCWHGAAAA
jgi:hypothetical protein